MKPSDLRYRLGASLLLVTALAVSPASAAEAGKLLPAEADVILTLNVRQFLDDHQKTDLVQHYLEPWRLALAGDEKRLTKYYRDQDLLKTEGLTEQEFLTRARLFQSFNDALGMDPFRDIDRVTCGFKTGDGGSLAVIVEGRFKEDKFRAAIQQVARQFFGVLKVTRVGEVELWHVADRADGAHLVLLNGKTLVITGDRKSMDGILARAAGNEKGGLSPGMRALLQKAEREHVALLANHTGALLKEAVKFLEERVARALDPKDAVGKLVVDQLTSWLRKYGEEFTAQGVALSIGADESRLQFGLVTRKPETADELRTSISRGSIVAALALKAVDDELARQLADILLRQRTSAQGTMLVVEVRVPHAFLEQVRKEARRMLAVMHHPYAEALTRRVLSIPIWGLPKQPPGALEVEEVRDVAYRDDAQADPIRHRLDLFVPKGKKDYPVVVLVHGGTWMMGDNRCCGLYSSVGRFLAGQGVGAVLPNYRLSPGPQHPDHVRDVARAAAWTRRNIAKYGGDPERLFLAGHSAGGHLVALLATDESYLKAEGLKTADLRGVIAVSGVYRIPPGPMAVTLGGAGSRAFRVDEVYPFRGDNSPAHFHLPGVPVRLDVFSPVFGDDPKERANASPVTHVRRGLPPFLIVVAETDLPTQADTADEFHQALRREGCEARLLKAARRNHSSVMFAAISPEDAVGRAMLEFLRAHDKK